MQSFSPLATRQRLVVIDTLRGFALFCILIANIPFAGIGQVPGIVFNWPAADKALDFIFHLLVDKKFVAIFSILFGFGFYIQLNRAEEKGIAFRPYFFRRMIILFVIGCLHAYLFWFGDIIRYYAIGGLFLLLLYKWPVKRLVQLAIFFAVFLTGLVFILNAALGLQEYSYDPALIREHPAAGSYARYLYINYVVDPLKNFLQDSPITLVFSFGNMLLGFALAKAGFFHEPGKFRKIINRLMWLGATAGIGCSYLFWCVTTGKLELTPALLWLPFVIVAGMLLQSLFYISAFVRLYQYIPFAKSAAVFAPVGRMALTNYMSQSVFYLLFFFRWTGGPFLYGKLTLTETYLFAALLFVAQVIISHYWLKKFEQGPVEYVWKKFSYPKYSMNSKIKIDLI
jgi:uncharacterized protein